MEELGKNGVTLVQNRERVKLHRERRRALGLHELKFWVRKSDVHKVLKLIQPFLKVADHLVHQSKGGRWSKNKLTVLEKNALDG